MLVHDVDCRQDRTTTFISTIMGIEHDMAATAELAIDLPHRFHLAVIVHEAFGFLEKLLPAMTQNSLV